MEEFTEAELESAKEDLESGYDTTASYYSNIDNDAGQEILLTHARWLRELKRNREDAEKLRHIASLAKEFIEACHEPDDGGDYYSQWSEGDLFKYNELMVALSAYYGLDWKLGDYAQGNLESYLDRKNNR